MSKKRKRTDSFFDAVDRILALLQNDRAARFKDSPSSNAEHELSLMHFAGAEPLMDPFTDEPLLSDENRGFFMDATPKDVDGQWDVAVVSAPCEEGNDAPDPDLAFSLSRIRSIPLSRVRGHRIFSPVACEVACAIIARDGRVVTGRSLDWYIGKQWLTQDRSFIEMRLDGLFADIPIKTGLRPENHRRIQTALGMQFNRYYEWRVTLGYENSIPLSFATDPTGAQEVFRLRDLPEGKSRRAALKHWVCEHWRQLRSTETKVREHLRGATEFYWNGLYCKIQPSPDDLLKNEKLRLEREAERAAGRRRLQRVS